MSHRQCARPNCASGPGYTRSEEFRIDGYCSVDCRDMDELEQRIAELEAALKEAEGALRHYAQPDLYGDTSALVAGPSTARTALARLESVLPQEPK